MTWKTVLWLLGCSLVFQDGNAAPADPDPPFVFLSIQGTHVPGETMPLTLEAHAIPAHFNFAVVFEDSDVTTTVATFTPSTAPPAPSEQIISVVIPTVLTASDVSVFISYPGQDSFLFQLLPLSFTTPQSSSIAPTPAPSTTTTSSSIATTPAPSTTTTSTITLVTTRVTTTRKTISIGQLIGGIVGGLGFMLVIGLILFFRLRRISVQNKEVVSPLESRQHGVFSSKNKRLMNSREGDRDASDGPPTKTFRPEADAQEPSAPIHFTSEPLQRIHSTLSNTRNGIPDRLNNSSQNYLERNRMIREFRHQDSGWRNPTITQDDQDYVSEVVELPPCYALE
ncbi:hypothetical protein D9757_010686 [Collybiopsis confluens]|uniref:Mid2 domain-containing protein n=1 Tax=Collybiopsis confluens TaxID=2823264 RepID=A0A8H5M383_9AGAR|nr:hypothetical protein D9757_010686 [Collybiopsis confluens]